MSGSAEVDAFAAAMRQAGLGLHGVLSTEDYDRIAPDALASGRMLPEARCAVLIGSAGGALWEACQRTHPSSANPVDDHTEAAVTGSLGLLGASPRALFAHRPWQGEWLDFVALGRASGLGFESRLGLLLHPQAGPWMSLRALVLSAAPAHPTPALAGPSPCVGCPAPCTRACPVGAPGPGGFDLRACATRRRTDPDCRQRCAARRACPVGQAFAYPPPAEAHHMERSLAAVVAWAGPTGKSGS